MFQSQILRDCCISLAEIAAMLDDSERLMYFQPSLVRISAGYRESVVKLLRYSSSLTSEMMESFLRCKAQLVFICEVGETEASVG
jgi:hypothetical protein